jgi:hypothetical protein
MVDMSTTIYDSSLLTQRRMNKAQSGSFIGRIQNYSNPTTGAPSLLGIWDQSIVNSVKQGQMRYYRKGDQGVTTVNNGCPCTPLENSSCQTN